MFSVLHTYKNSRIPAAAHSLTRWHDIELCFFFNVEDGNIVLSSTL